jgi:hypothetical protein
VIVRAGCRTGPRRPAHPRPTHASGRATFCHTRRTASPLLRPHEPQPHVRRSRFLEADPIEGGSANDYDYVNGDPINSFDLAGLCNSAEVWCVIGILKGTEELPDGFAAWQAGRREGGFVYYVNTRRGNRAVLSSGSCSVPGPGSFKNACRTHDLGYNLMRFFGSSGRRGSSRKAVDNLLFNDFKGVCGGLSWWRRPGCGIAARAGYQIVAANRWNQGYGVP